MWGMALLGPVANYRGYSSVYCDDLPQQQPRLLHAMESHDDDDSPSPEETAVDRDGGCDEAVEEGFLTWTGPTCGGDLDHHLCRVLGGLGMDDDANA
jgi:hypothetical protein